ncbi:MAG: 4-hydroxy-3-methylbut-2-enyl diphosphate reductase [Erysipelotrichaceae bacterium]|nr:4-hydroxy-3-methylbut-2-enyl diphosphate reductase [Erysipelotrichaceae bacterium]
MKVTIIKPYGFCLGVENVIKQINDIINKHQNEKIYCLGQIVHNDKVIQNLIQKGVTFLYGDKKQEILKLRSGVVVFSAHGSDESLVNMAKEKGLITYDFACPFVKKEFQIIKDKIKEGYSVIYIGIKNHEETIAALSISDKITFVETIDDVKKLNIVNDKIMVINQTTLSIIKLQAIFDAIKEKYPNVLIIDEICNSTRLRQSFLLDLDNSVDGVIVIGDKTSNNTKSLYLTAVNKGFDTIMIDDVKQLNDSWLKDKSNINILSGASTPKEIVDDVYEYINKKYN